MSADAAAAPRAHSVRINDAALRSIAWIVGIGSLLGVALAVILFVVGGEHYGDTDPTDMVLPTTFAIVGTFLATRLPRNPVGWLFLFMAAVLALQEIATTYSFAALATHRTWPAGNWALWASTWLTALVFPTGGAPLVMSLLPDGRLPSQRWRVFPWICMGSALVLAGLFVVSPGPLSSNAWAGNVVNPIGISALSFAASAGASSSVWFAGVAVVLVAAAAPFLRMRHATPVVRQQLRWIAYAIAVTTLLVAAESLVGVLDQSVGDSAAISAAFTWTNIAGYGIALPAATAIAVVKYRLYDIDTAINRTVVYGSLAVFITAVYVAIAVGAGTLAGSGGKPNLALSIVATAIVAVGFQPVRQRVQRVANRLVYGRRATPYEALSRFAENVGGEVASDDLFPRMARVLAEGTGAQRADVWSRTRDGALHVIASFPAEAPAHADVAPSGNAAAAGVDRLVPVLHQGDMLGALSVTKRAGESLTPVEDGLITDLAAQAGLLLRNAGLTADLRARYDELRASRQRLVTAQDEERRRIERNLHDGAQQNLVALKVKLGLAEMLMERDTPKALDTLESLKNDADEALETLRDLARGIYPPLLADQGLFAALQSQARKATVEVVVENENVTRYPQDVESAVYFCILEALQNVQKYAQATRVTVRLRDDGSELHFAVTDDGCGFDLDRVRRGLGLTNMTDRLDAVGGELEVRSGPGAGTTVSGVMPITSLVEATA